MQAGVLSPVRSVSTVNWIGSIAQNAIAYEDILLPKNIGANTSRSRLRSLRIISGENLAWEVHLFGAKQPFTQLDVDLNANPPNYGYPLLGFWPFLANQGVQLGGAGKWLYYKDGLDVGYEDRDWELHPGATGVLPNGVIANSFDAYLHAGLVNRSAAAKTAGAVGALVVEFVFEVTFGI